MNTDDLDDLMLTLAYSSYAVELLVVPDFVKHSKMYREKLVQQLEIPTFMKSKKVMFYDTLQKLAIRVVRLHHTKTAL